MNLEESCHHFLGLRKLLPSVWHSSCRGKFNLSCRATITFTFIYILLSEVWTPHGQWHVKETVWRRHTGISFCCFLTLIFLFNQLFILSAYSSHYSEWIHASISILLLTGWIVFLTLINTLFERVLKLAVSICYFRWLCVLCDLYPWNGRMH